MNLWSLLLPFKWFIIGVEEVFRGIFNLIKGIISLVGSLFKYLFKAITLIIQGLGFFLGEILFKHLFILLKWLVLKLGFLVTLFFRVIKYIIVGFGKTLRFIVVNVFVGIITVIKFIFISLKFIITCIYKSIYVIFKYLFIVLKFIATRLYKGISLIFKYLFMALKFIATGLYNGISLVFKYLYIILKFIATGLYKGIFLVFKSLFIAVKTILLYIYKGIKIFAIYLSKGLKLLFIDLLFKAIFNGVTYILKLLSNIPKVIYKGLKVVGRGLYQVFVKPFIYLKKNFGNMVAKLFGVIKTSLKNTFKFIGSIPKKMKTSVGTWFHNLSFIKDIRNKREMSHQALLIDFDAETSARTENKVTYHFVAKNTNGKIEKGYLGAYSKLDVHSYLLSEGYEVYKIEPAKGFRLSRAVSHKMRMNELVFFLTQLSTYIKSGIPLVDSIKILGKQASTSGTKSLYKAIIYDLTMGENFSGALDKQSTAFPRLLVNMVKSSELAGNLSETLDDMAGYYTAISKTRKQMKTAMTYPAVIFVFASAVVIFLLTFVIPSFIDMYKQADANVPALTLTIIGLSDFLVNNYVFLIIGVAALFTGFYYMYKNVKLFKSFIQWILMHVPVVGKIIIYNEVTMFSKTFASLWNHNVFITSSMEILSKITNNEIYKMLIFDAITNVARGEPVSSSFKNHWAFPVVAYEMLVTGERTGQPGPMMDKVAEYYQEEHENAVNAIKTFIEPAMIIFLAVVVGTILLAVVLPMFDIYGQIGVQS